MEEQDKTRENIAKYLYEQARHSANLLYEMLHRFNPDPDERYEAWTKKWGKWASASDLIKKVYLLQADQLLEFIPDLKLLWKLDADRNWSVGEWLKTLPRYFQVIKEEGGKAERERIMKIFASFGKVQLKKPLSGKEFEALFD